VRASETSLDVNMPSTQKYQGLSDTVASERLDCVVASLCNLSRERAQNLIRAGLVEFNYETAQKTDVKCAADDIISARGYGKFVIRSISEQTRKGRLRLLADKYV
jgi:RNA-binding protein YlmH